MLAATTMDNQNERQQQQQQQKQQQQLRTPSSKEEGDDTRTLSLLVYRYPGDDDEICVRVPSTASIDTLVCEIRRKGGDAWLGLYFRCDEITISFSPEREDTLSALPAGDDSVVYLSPFALCGDD